MPFFDIPDEATLAPEVQRLFAQHRSLASTEAVPPGTSAFALTPKIFESRLVVRAKLYSECSFSHAATSLAFMLIAHKAKCQVCFVGSRRDLDRLGFDEAALDAICARPEDLPVPDRDRAFIGFAIRVATEPEGLRRKDFEEMQSGGFSKAEIQEIIGFAAFVNFHMTFTKSQIAWLSEA